MQKVVERRVECSTRIRKRAPFVAVPGLRVRRRCRHAVMQRCRGFHGGPHLVRFTPMFVGAQHSVHDGHVAADDCGNQKRYEDCADHNFRFVELLCFISSGFELSTPCSVEQSAGGSRRAHRFLRRTLRILHLKSRVAARRSLAHFDIHETELFEDFSAAKQRPPLVKIDFQRTPHCHPAIIRLRPAPAGFHRRGRF